AALWKLPVVFICENKEYSMGTPLTRTMSVDDVSHKAGAYGMAKDRIFVRDVLEFEARVAEAVERARTTSEPTLIEARTYRFRGHSMSDPGKYRTPAELEEQKKKDTLAQARATLVEGGAGEKLAEIEADVEREVEEAVKFAEESPEPSADILEPTTYAGPFAR
ncbi:MAG: thiamine pyrophosphate-dependent enzyme, partial [Polyangiaceae bacterium]